VQTKLGHCENQIGPLRARVGRYQKRGTIPNPDDLLCPARSRAGTTSPKGGGLSVIPALGPFLLALGAVVSLAAERTKKLGFERGMGSGSV
jgi:hypothetical protein